MRSSHHPRPRRGGVYIAVLGSAMIISVLALMAITQQRLQRRMFERSADSQQAELLAQGALRLAIDRIETDANWRNYYADPANLFDVVVSAGTMRVEVVDPYDGDLTDSDEDPVVITGIGIAGAAERRFAQTLIAQRSPLGSVYAAISCGSLSLTGATIRAEKVIDTQSASLSASLPKSHVYADVNATTFTGEEFHGTNTTIALVDLLQQPNWATLASHYIDLAQAIDINSLPPNQGPNMLLNSDMEAGQGKGLPADDWSGIPVPPDTGTCDVVQDDKSHAYTGQFGIKVKLRDDWSAGPTQDTNWVQAGRSYYVEAWIKPKEIGDYRFAWYTQGSAGQYTYSVPQSCTKNIWTMMSATMIPSWPGSLNTAFLKIQNQDGAVAEDFYVDGFAAYEVLDARALNRQLLSPNHNPFEPAETNAQGIYFIDCGGQDLFIENSRILGTLIIKNPGSNSVIRGAVNWAPFVSGYPACIVTGSDALSDIELATTRERLNEKRLNVNFNPPGAPYGTLGTDSDMNDTLPSEIKGLFCVDGQLEIANNPVVRGSILVRDNVDASSGELHVYHDSTSAHNPPPKFEATVRMVPVVGDAKKAVQ